MRWDANMWNKIRAIALTSDIDLEYTGDNGERYGFAGPFPLLFGLLEGVNPHMAGLLAGGMFESMEIMYDHITEEPKP